MSMCLNALLIGEVRPLGERSVPSGIDKQLVGRSLRVTREGLEGDAQGDRRHHGGPDKAVHHYPFEHYTTWCKEIGPLAVLDRPGAFGENLSTLGVDESVIAVGDVFRLGSATFEVSQGRQPCWKLNLRFGVADMARRVQANGRTGWYYRVIEEGIVTPGDDLILLDRRSPEWTLHRLCRALYVETLNRDELSAIAELGHLPVSWRQLAVRRLEKGVVEDWNSRLRDIPFREE